MNVTAIIYAVVVFLVVILLLVAILLLAKRFLVSSGNVKVTINGDKEYDVAAGGSLLSQLGEAGVHLPSACGGKGSCGQCKCQVLSGGGEILPTETVHFSRKQQKEGWRLGCQVKVKEDITMKVDEAVLGVKEWECEVISNKNVATFIKEFKVQLPPGEHMNFEPGSYAQIIIPEYDIDYDRDMDKSLIGDLYLPAWKNFGLFKLKQKNTQATVRAYSMANYPDEGDIITLTVRIATPPFKPKDQCPNGPEFMDVPCGIASTYIFSLKPGDKVRMSGGNDLGRRWCRYGAFARTDYAHAQDPSVPRPRNALFLRCTCYRRSLLLGRFPRFGEGVPELPFPPCIGPSGPEGRRTGHQVHGRLYCSCDGRYLSQAA